MTADAQKIFAGGDYKAKFAEFKDDDTTLRCRAVLWSKMRRGTYIPARQCNHTAKHDLKRGKATHCHTHSDGHVDKKAHDKLVWDLTQMIKIDETEATKLVDKYGAA